MSLFDIPANLVALARLCRPPVPTGHEVWLQAVEEEVECLEACDDPRCCPAPIRPASGAGSGAEEVSTQAIPPAVPPVPSSALPEDLTFAAGVVKAYAALGCSDAAEREELRALADRLSQASTQDQMQAAHERVAEKLKRLK